MSVGVFALHRRNHAWGGQIYSAYVCYADFMVYHTNYLYYVRGTFYSENPGDFLGLSADLVDQFGDIPDILLESGLVTWI